VRQTDSKYECTDRNCKLTVIKTICSEQSCKHQFKYLSYDICPEVLEKMKKIADDPDDFYANDSLFQYKDIVGLSIEREELNLKIRPRCPKCGVVGGKTSAYNTDIKIRQNR
jgi:hypothetical protein